MIGNVKRELVNINYKTKENKERGLNQLAPLVTGQSYYLDKTFLSYFLHFFSFIIISYLPLRAGRNWKEKERKRHKKKRERDKCW